MTNSDLPAFTAELARMGEVFGKAVSADLAATYFRDLEDLALPSVVRGMEIARRSLTFWPKVAQIRAVCQTDSRAVVKTDIPTWVDHDQDRFFCDLCQDCGFTRGLECAGDGACRLAGCGRAGHANAPHAYTRPCGCRSRNPVLIRQREISRQYRANANKE